MLCVDSPQDAGEFEPPSNFFSVIETVDSYLWRHSWAPSWRGQGRPAVGRGGGGGRERRRKSRGRKGGVRSLQNPLSPSKGSVKDSLEGGRQEAENSHGAPCPHHRQQKWEGEAELPPTKEGVSGGRGDPASPFLLSTYCLWRTNQKPKGQGWGSQGMHQDRPAPALRDWRQQRGKLRCPTCPPPQHRHMFHCENVDGTIENTCNTSLCPGPGCVCDAPSPVAGWHSLNFVLWCLPGLPSGIVVGCDLPAPC